MQYYGFHGGRRSRTATMLTFFLNQNPNGFRETINGFPNSQESHLRFGEVEQ